MKNIVIEAPHHIQRVDIKLDKKGIVSMTPETVKINLDEMPKHEMDALCRVVLRGATEAFKDPKFIAMHEQRLAEKAKRIKEAI